MSSKANFENSPQRIPISCPEHGKAFIIGFSSDAMWHPATGEPKPPYSWTVSCTAVTKTRCFLFWKWSKICSFEITTYE